MRISYRVADAESSLRSEEAHLRQRREPSFGLRLRQRPHRPASSATFRRFARSRRLKARTIAATPSSSSIMEEGVRVADAKSCIMPKGNPVCPRCKRQDSPLTVDHIVPRACGGSNHLLNLQLLCRRCNARKWATLETGVEFSLFDDPKPEPPRGGPPTCERCENQVPKALFWAFSLASTTKRS